MDLYFGNIIYTPTLFLHLLPYYVSAKHERVLEQLYARTEASEDPELCHHHGKIVMQNGAWKWCMGTPDQLGYVPKHIGSMCFCSRMRLKLQNQSIHLPLHFQAMWCELGIRSRTTTFGEPSHQGVGKISKSGFNMQSECMHFHRRLARRAMVTDLQIANIQVIFAVKAVAEC